MDQPTLKHLAELGLIFGFVIVVIAINSYRRLRQQKLWHETARLALEKGQPLPEFAPWRGCAWPGHGRTRWCEMRHGLVLIALGAAMYLAIPGQPRLWAAVPGFIGIALLVCSLFAPPQPPPSGDSQDGPGQK